MGHSLALSLISKYGIWISPQYFVHMILSHYPIFYDTPSLIKMGEKTKETRQWHIKLNLNVKKIAKVKHFMIGKPYDANKEKHFIKKQKKEAHMKNYGD